MWARFSRCSTLSLLESSSVKHNAFLVLFLNVSSVAGAFQRDAPMNGGGGGAELLRCCVPTAGKKAAGTRLLFQ